ncbi:hypothetical protein [Paenibacillus herberti]|uniref:Uncharacterized protein n=1 Tax=Paenibacillus herberti TaxID=1619309 RepID=A0A229P5F1_9BACL|nr:hypothetical protein [Paenibacillus herberti]OXM17320.1 hypothetical protein CGZ75_12155 [Paenibacillus herberti]
MTLDEMIQQCAGDIDETLTKSAAGTYEGEELSVASKIVTGINYAYQLIAREKYVLTAVEPVVLSERGSFDLSSLTMPAVKLLNVYADDEAVDWTQRNQSTIYCLGFGATNPQVEYAYLPPRLPISNLAAVPLVPENRVDHLLFCYYANFYVLSLEPDNESREKAATFLGLFNSAFDQLQTRVSQYMTFSVER